MSKRSAFAFFERAVSWSLCALLLLTAYVALTKDTPALAAKMCEEPWRWKTLAVALLVYAAVAGTLAGVYRDRLRKLGERT